MHPSDVSSRILTYTIGTEAPVVTPVLTPRVIRDAVGEPRSDATNDENDAEHDVDDIESIEGHRLETTAGDDLV